VQVSELVPEESTLRLELFVRSLAPDTARAQQEAIIERLQRLSEVELVDTTDIYVTGDCVCPSTVAAETQAGRFLLNRYAAFRSWAEQTDAELVGFREKCVDSSMAGGTVTGIRFPRLLIAVFADDTLQFVAPSTSNGIETTVIDLQKSLERQIQS
jgi:hypothetical protein